MRKVICHHLKMYNVLKRTDLSHLAAYLCCEILFIDEVLIGKYLCKYLDRDCQRALLAI